MGEIVTSLYVATALYNGIYLEPDCGNSYQISEKQYIIGSSEKNVGTLEKVTMLDNKQIFLKGYYEKQHD